MPLAPTATALPSRPYTPDAFFNDNEPFVLPWLRDLFPGATIFGTSIADLQPEDVIGFKRVHLFAGIGGWEHALRLAGWPEDEEVWTGSCPCQPFSTAGKQRGTDDERHLWPEFLRLIAECRPAVVFGEQVASSLGRTWLAGVRADLEALGYRVGAADLSAASTGAPHIRQRLYWVAERGDLFDGLAYADGHGHDRARGDAAEQGGDWQDDGVSVGRGAEDRRAGLGLADAERDLRAEGWAAGEPGEGAGEDTERAPVEPRRRGDSGNGLADSDRGGQRPGGGLGGGSEARDDSRWGGEDGGLANTRRLERSGRGGSGNLAGTPGGDKEEGDQRERHGDASRYGSADGGTWPDGLVDALFPGLEGHTGDVDGGGEPGRESADEGGPTPPAGGAGSGPANTLPGFWDDYDLLPCIDGKSRRVEPGTFPLAHGVPARVGRIRAYGGSIVPQVAAAFITAYRESRADREL